MFADDINHTLPRLRQILQRVLRLIETSRIPNDENRWIVINDLRIRERRQVRTTPVFRPRTHEPNRPRDDSRDEKLVVERRRSAVFVRVDLDMLVLLPLPAVVGAHAWFPVRHRCLGHFPHVVAAPVVPACFHFFEVAVRVAFDVFLAIEVSDLVEMNGLLGCTCPSSARGCW